MLQHFKYSTRVAYSAGINWWQQFCQQFGISIFTPTLEEVEHFFITFFGITSQKGATIKTYKIAIMYLFPYELQQKLLSTDFRFMLDGFSKQRPSVPHLPPAIWNIEIVLYHLARYPPANCLSFWMSCKKTITLLLLATSRRCADVMAISVADSFLFEGTDRVIAFLARLSKTYSDDNKNVQEMHIYKYHNIDSDLCLVIHLKYLIAMSEKLREKTGCRYNSLFVTEKGRPAKCDTCAKWVKEVLTESGTNPSVYTPHSAHSASACHKLKNYPLETVLSHGAWASDHTFKTHYMHPVMATVPSVNLHPHFGSNPHVNNSLIRNKQHYARAQKKRVVSKSVKQNKSKSKAKQSASATPKSTCLCKVLKMLSSGSCLFRNN